MQSFLQSIRAIGLIPKSRRPQLSATTQPQFRPTRARLATTLVLSSLALSSIEGALFPRAAAAAPTRKDWCGTIWSVENTSTLAWIKPTTGVTISTSGPTAQITMPGGSMGTSVAAIGIHKESGTMFAFDRTGTTGQLYKYQFGVDTSWIPVGVSGLVGLSGTQSITNASNNLNKMTVDGNILYLTDSTGIAFYSVALNNNGSVMSAAATAETYVFAGDPAGTPAHSIAAMNGGDITTDEYGDSYNVTYTSTNAYFYKQDPVAKTWVYQGETTATAAFAGAAFYKGDLYVKAGTQLKKVDLTRSGSGYTGWNNPLVNVGTPSATSSADLTACGTPDLTITKTQQIYTDAAATTLAADQTKAKPGGYIKYTITVKNTGDSWARSGNLADNLPIGTSYVPNSATLNGTNLGIATYPATGFPINAPGLATGVLPFAPDPDTAIVSFVTLVTATTGSIQNRAIVTYIDSTGLVSETPVCTLPAVNCGLTPTLPVAPVDFGDAPDTGVGTSTGNYRSIASDNGPAHVIVAGLQLGATAPDGDDGLQQSVGATADGTDEDAFTTLPNVPTTGTYTLSNIPVTNTTGRMATLSAWIDFNNNGSFESGEYTSAVVGNGATTANLSWTVPAGTVAGSTYARFRLSTQALTDNAGTANEDERSFGLASDGEVEDYQVTIAPSTPPFVCDSNIYMTKGSGGTTGLYEVLISGSSVTFSPLIGTETTAVNAIAFREADGYIYALRSSNLIRIDSTGAQTDLGAVTNLPAGSYISGDFGPDGYYYVLLNSGGALQKIDIDTRTRVSQGGTTPGNTPDIAIHRTNGFAYGVRNGGRPIRIPVAGGAGVEFGPDHNKSFGAVYSDVLGNVYLSVNDTNDIYQLDIVTGDITKVADFNPDVAAFSNDGAFCKSATFSTSPVDRSDAPISGTAPNGTGTNSYGEAVHAIVSGKRLGAAIDRDMSSIVDATASGDGADDDGISNFPILTAGATSYSIPAANVSATGTGTLHAWIDFNQDGLFSATEYSSVSVTNGIVSGPLNWSGIVSGSSAKTFVRLRFTSAALTDNTATTNTDERAVGFANDGEVEDYQVPIAGQPSDPNVLLVKRITGINGGMNTVMGDSLATYIDELTNPYDDNTITIPNQALPTDPPKDTDKWPDPTTSLIGGINGGQIKPGDELEYTIYFLSAGAAEAKNVLFCDRIPSNVSFLPTAFNAVSPAIGGLPGADRGILLNLNSSSLALTNIGDGDIGQFFPAGVEPTTVYPQISCGGPNTNGVVVVKLGDLPNATAPGVPANAFGFVRFRAHVK
jgi:uncharacterized repeat protein (TIGR01451 family)